MTGQPLETVTLEAGNAAYGGWQSVTLRASAEEAVRTASFVFAMPPRAAIGSFGLRPDMEARVFVSGELWLTGFVGDVTPGHDADGGSIGVEVVSKTIDAVESSVDHPTGRVDEADLETIARTFESAGVEWTALDTTEVEPWHDVDPGETSFQTVERASRARGRLIYDDETGRAVIASKPEGRHSGGLALGVNIVMASSKLSGRGRHNPVIVRGQASAGHGPGALRIEARAADPGVGRVRPKVIILEEDASPDRAKKRAEWQVRRAAGRSREASVTVAGWRDAGGKIWSRNWLVGLDNPLILLRQDMAIKAVELTQDAGSDGESGSTVATLTLADPRALGGEASAGSSDAVWNTPEDEAEVTAQ